MVYTRDLGSRAERRAGSSPVPATYERRKMINSTHELDELFRQTNFAEDRNVIPKWSNTSESLDDGDDDYPYVPECSYFGGTLIQLAGDYEGGDRDCFFIQELVRLCKEGRLEITQTVIDEGLEASRKLEEHFAVNKEDKRGLLRRMVEVIIGKSF